MNWLGEESFNLHELRVEVSINEIDFPIHQEVNASETEVNNNKHVVNQ